MKTPIISIITICYNAESVIEKTLLSVIRQTYKNVEYIIIDGNSKDNTINIVKKYSNQIQKILSEPDDGIYFAMNKGINESSGEWCIFMNAGDSFYSENTLENAVSLFDYRNDIIYGNTEYIFDSGPMIRTPKPLSYVTEGAFCCHQSAFFRRNVLKKHKFDTNYRIIADWALFKTLYENKYKFQYIDTVISIFDNVSGTSSSNNIKSFISHKKEKLRCKGQDNSYHKAVLYLSSIFFYFRRNILKPLLPLKIYNTLKSKWIELHN